jgi:hypothetical protein
MAILHPAKPYFPYTSNGWQEGTSCHYKQVLPPFENIKYFSLPLTHIYLDAF